MMNHPGIHEIDDDDDGTPAGANFNAKHRHFSSAPRPIRLGPHGSPMAFESRRVVRLHGVKAGSWGETARGLMLLLLTKLMIDRRGGRLRSVGIITEAGIRIRVPRGPAEVQSRRRR